MDAGKQKQNNIKCLCENVNLNVSNADIVGLKIQQFNFGCGWLWASFQSGVH